MTTIDKFAVMFIGRKMIITDLLVKYMNISIQDCAILIKSHSFNNSIKFIKIIYTTQRIG